MRSVTGRESRNLEESRSEMKLQNRVSGDFSGTFYGNVKSILREFSGLFSEFGRFWPQGHYCPILFEKPFILTLLIFGKWIGMIMGPAFKGTGRLSFFFAGGGSPGPKAPRRSRVRVPEGAGSRGPRVGNRGAG